MGKEDVRRALEAMLEDDVVAEKFQAGDFTAVDGLDLNDEEQTLVRDAAGDLPEVAGFASDYLLELDGIKGESSSKFHKMHKLDTQFFKFQTAVNYWKL